VEEEEEKKKKKEKEEAKTRQYDLHLTKYITNTLEESLYLRIQYVLS
jgi:hypothetical protein